MGRTANDTVSIYVSTTGTTISGIPWFDGMNVQQAMEAAYPQGFTFAVEYYGSTYGYFILMVDGTLNADPMYWFLYVNGVETSTGIDTTILNAGDAVELEYEQYNAQTQPAEIHKLRQDSARKAAAKRAA